MVDHLIPYKKTKEEPINSLPDSSKFYRFW